MHIDQFIELLKADSGFMSNVISWKTIPSQEAQFVPLPQGIHPRLIQALEKQGVNQLFSHQAEAYETVQQDLNPVIITPTASGKTLAYLIPVLDHILKNPAARAIFLFPTKALSQDQWKVLDELNLHGGLGISSFTFDGDTSPAARKSIRQAGQIIITNPDMLHAGILPHHINWIQLFENLAFIVMDELHSYKGVFGSHLANVMRRLKRIIRFYGGKKIHYILSSATIANPLEHAANLVQEKEDKFKLIDKSGASAGARQYIFYNPPLIQKELGIRRSAIKEALNIGRLLIKSGIPALFFARSRIRVEVLANYLRRVDKARSGGVRSYRGGYLPLERRAIESGIRSGAIHTIVSTNALELGVDIGNLDVVVSVGYPGSLASMRQQFGRAGRTGRTSVAILIATSSPLEQFFMKNPAMLLEGSMERALVNPDNLLIQTDHLKCAAFEIPLEIGEPFGSIPLEELADYLTREGVLKKEQNRYHWMSEIFPANEISLRSASQENFVIIEKANNNRVIGEIDLYAAPTLIHEDAIYLHQGESYFIEKLDWQKRQAYARLCKPDYFTDGEEKVNFQILSREHSISFAEFAPGREGAASSTAPGPLFDINFGEIALHKQAVLFKKIKMFTHENIGWGKISLPEIQMHTQAMWISFAEEWFMSKVPVGIQGPVIAALSHLLGLMAPGFVLCDPSDLKARGLVRSPFEEKPIILFYDSYPGGIALSQRLFHLVQDLIYAGLELIRKCPCESGCPSCIGPVEMILLSQSKEAQISGGNEINFGNEDFSRIKELCSEILATLLKSFQLQAIEKPMLEVERFSREKNKNEH